MQVYQYLLKLNTRVYGLSDDFRNQRERLNLSRGQLADLLGLNKYSVDEYELGRTGIRLSILKTLYQKNGKGDGHLVLKLLNQCVHLKVDGSSQMFHMSFYNKKEPIKCPIPKFGLDIWSTDFRVIISEWMINTISDLIQEAGGIFLVMKLQNLTRERIYRLLRGKGSSVQTYYQLINILGLNPKIAEENIVGLTYNGCKRTYPFINRMNPRLFRIICHVIGDGTVSSKHTCRWIQNKDNSYWIKELIEQQTGMAPTVSKSTTNTCEMVTISAYYSRLVKYSLGIDIRRIKEAKTINCFLDLPKDYQLQFVCAFIVDEGHIRYKKARSCVISQNNYQFMKAISRILSSLDYAHSIIRKETSKNGYVIYRINIYKAGMVKLNKDLNKAIEKYGSLLGLWHKQTELDGYIRTLK